MSKTYTHQTQLRLGSTISEANRARLRAVREEIRKRIEEREGKDEIKYWERRHWLRGGK